MFDKAPVPQNQRESEPQVKAPSLTPSQIEALKLDTLQSVLYKLEAAEIAGFPSNAHLLLVGDSAKAWQFRERMLTLAKSEQSQPERESLLQTALLSLTGVPGKKAIEFIGRLKEAGAEISQREILDACSGDSSAAVNAIRLQVLKEKDLMSVDSVLRSLRAMPYQQSQAMFDKVLGTLRSFSQDDFKGEEGGSLENGVSLLTMAIDAALDGLDARVAAPLREKFVSLIKEKTGVEVKRDPEEEDLLRLFAQNGKDTAEAWRIRTELLAKYKTNPDMVESIADSLKGIGTPQSEDFRRELVKQGLSEAKLIESYAGVDTEAAWQIREKLYKDLKAKGETYASGDDLALRASEPLREAAVQEALQKLADKGKISFPPTEEDVDRLQTDEALSKEFYSLVDKFIIEGMGGVYKAAPNRNFDLRNEADRNALIEQGEIERRIPSVYTLTMSMEGLTSDRAFDFVKKMTEEMVPTDALLNVLNDSFESGMHRFRTYLIDKLPGHMLQDLVRLTGNMKTIG